jgi:5-formyltetrahydrofolate cyclo-ligase
VLKNTSNPKMNSAILRKKIRAQRRLMSRSERHLAEKKLSSHLETIGIVRRAKRLAVYLSIDGEPDLTITIFKAQKRNTTTLAPIIHGKTLRFSPLSNQSVLRKNHLGIQEPSGRACINPLQLDVVLVPLVAFDNHGTRVGMGAGYYDRYFQFLALRTHWRKPKMIGIGYEFQRMENLQRQLWDVPLWGAVTDKGIYKFEAGEGKK